MIKAEKLSYGFPQKDLYRNISFTLDEGRHCALIGSNGSGKTTLAQLLCTPERFLFDGKLIRENVGRIGYVTQFAVREKDQSATVQDYLMEDAEALRQAVDQVCTALETAEDPEPLLERYQQLLDEQDAMDADNAEVNIRHQLHLAELDGKAGLPLSLLSGGEYKLVQVIRQMLRRPGLLIMDEPDVFLDFANLNGLRDLINAYRGTLLVVTHSRYLLSCCFDQIWHLENGDLQEFDGTFRAYQFSLLTRKVELQQAAARDEAEIQRTALLVERLRKEATEVIDPRKGRVLKGKATYLARQQARQIKPPFVALQRPDIRLPEAAPLEPETPVLTVSGYGLAFAQPLLSGVSFTVRAGEKVAVVGPNGTGKTSMLRDLWRAQDPAVRYGSGVRTGFFSQLQEETLDEKRTVLEELADAGLEGPEAEQYLAAWCFAPDGLHRRVGQLSGGEKNLLQLARLALSERELLLLDEPSSHLDTFAQLALEEALSRYQGAVLMVSHDFFTIANCMDRVLLVEDGTLRPMSIRAFRKMIYKHHFSREEVELETQKKTLETRIAGLLAQDRTDEAAALLEQLAPIVTDMDRRIGG